MIRLRYTQTNKFILTHYTYYCIQTGMALDNLPRSDSAFQTYDEWENDMERRFDTMPDWWWRGRIRRLAEYGSVISGQIHRTRAGNNTGF